MYKKFNVTKVITFSGDDSVLRKLQIDYKMGLDIIKTYPGYAATSVFPSQQEIEIRNPNENVIIAGKLVTGNVIENCVVGDKTGEWFFIREAFYVIEDGILWIEA